VSSERRVVITGMSVNTPLGDTLDGFLNGLMAGRSAITTWKRVSNPPIYSKVGADLTDYDIAAKVKSWEGRLSAERYRALRRFAARAAWSTKLSLLIGLDAFADAGLLDAELPSERTGVLVAGHNINLNYQYESRLQFAEEPDYIDSMFSVHGLDTDHAASVAELLNARGPTYTLGGACASGNLALRSAVDEIRYHDVDRCVVLGAVFDLSPVDLHAMALMGAVSYQSFNDDPPRASRPFDTRREGFVPAHGGAALIVEDLETARRRGARIYAEVLGVEANSDANHLPQPSEEGQFAVMTKLLAKCGIAPEQIDYVSAHATSTPLGDLTEVRSIRRLLGKQAGRVKINAPKSMLGHTCWSAPTVETVAAVLQMRAGRLHPSINIENRDPEIDLDVCDGVASDHTINHFLKNSFGFGGINCVSLFKRYES
jgi:3-oxoacyl-(acyl-carrier-protein) synthase